MSVPKPDAVSDILVTINKIAGFAAPQPVSVGDLNVHLTRLALALSDYVRHSEERITALTMRVGMLEPKK